MTMHPTHIEQDKLMRIQREISTWPLSERTQENIEALNARETAHGDRMECRYAPPDVLSVYWTQKDWDNHCQNPKHRIN